MNKPHIRAHIRLMTNEDIAKFMAAISNLDDTYSIEDFDGIQRANAKSTLGVMYATCDFGNQLYLVNETNDGYFPSVFDSFRA